MLRIYFLVTALWLTWVESRLGPPRRKDERGSVTIENVLWAVAVIGIVAIVVGAITAYVRSQSTGLR